MDSTGPPGQLDLQVSRRDAARLTFELLGRIRLITEGGLMLSLAVATTAEPLRGALILAAGPQPHASLNRYLAGLDEGELLCLWGLLGDVRAGLDCIAAADKVTLVRHVSADELAVLADEADAQRGGGGQ